ncbi:MAG: ABC transporter ATP-binding protein [Xanthomonadales bacterium]|nr:ABC transporter ATP-binding protein [Xanthomonadales bacterium]
MSAASLRLSGLVADRGIRRVLDGVSLEVARGEWVVLLGANGSGKSTLVDCCSGRLEPRGGTVVIAGHDLGTDPVAARAALGAAGPPQRLPELLSARECLAIMAAARGLALIDAEVLELASTLDLAPWLDDAVALMSLGTRQKLCVLLALLGDPALILLDEAFNGLDATSSLRLKQHLADRVRAGRCGVLLATHALDIAGHWADRAVLLHQGRIVHAWNRAELKALRTTPGGLEAALAARMTAADTAGHA